MNGITTQSTAADGTTDSLALRVVEAIATELDADPLEIDPLYGSVDPDALEQLFAGIGRGGAARIDRVAFTHAGCDVTVFADGEIQVDQLTADGSDPEGNDPEGSTQIVVE